MTNDDRPPERPKNADPPTRHRIEYRRRRWSSWEQLCVTGSKDMANRLLVELASRVADSYDWRVQPVADRRRPSQGDHQDAIDPGTG